MSNKKIIAVVGATGAQGGGLVRAILNHPDSGFTVRAITRDIQSDKAQQLAQSGAEIVQGDVDDIDSLIKAFSGAYGVFCVTFFWAHFSPEKELQHAQNMAKAAKENNIQHVIWSTLEDTRKWIPLDDNRMPTLMGKYKTPHLDGKGEADHYFTDLGLPVTFLLTSAYFENLIYFGMGPQKGSDGKYYLTIPMGDKKLPWIATEDIGKCALGIFKKGKDYIGKTVGVAGEHLTGYESADKLSKALGREILYNKISFDDYRNLGFPGAEDLGNMFQFKHDFNDYFCGVRAITESRSLNPELQDFDTWLSKNKKRISME